MSRPRQQPEPPAPPQNIEAEESVLGAMMLAPGAFAAVVELVTPADFYRDSHGQIFAAGLRISERGEPVDAIAVIDDLEKTPAPDGGNMLEQVGGRTRILELVELTPASANAAHYARIVAELAVLRGLIRGGGEIATLGWERPGPLPELLNQAEQIVFDVSQHGQRADVGPVPAREILRSVIERIEALYQGGDKVIGLPTGWERFDVLTSGLQPGNLVVVAARPSMGKSAFALGICAHAAFRSGVPVLLFTLEMSRSEVIQRLIACEGLVESQHIRNGQLSTEEWDRVYNVSEKIRTSPLFIDDDGAVTMPEIRSRARRLKLRQPTLGLVVVDYLQLMSGTGNQQSRVQQIADISRGLKVLARELNVPILALSQLSRQPEQRHDSRPILSDLRESGAIEQDADLVAFIYRDEYYHPEDTDQEGIAEVNIAKQRNGPTEMLKLAFVKRYARFSDLPLPGTGGLA